MMGAMGVELKSKRFIESWMGKLALLLLGGVWIFSMSGVDSNAYSALPVTIGVGIVSLLIVGGVCSGYKLVRMSMLGWISLVGVGGYFLVRCCMSYSIVEAWREGALILGCMVFYLMGVYSAQLRKNGWLYGVLLVAVLLNLLYTYLMNYTDISMIYTGRPEVGLTGINTRPSSLFLYKNVSGAFVMLGGFLLLNAALWQRQGRIVYALVGIVGIVVSFYYKADIVYVLLPLLSIGTLLIQFANCLFTGKKLGWIWILSGIVTLVAVGIGVCEFVFNQELFRSAMEVETTGRNRIWEAVLKVAFNAPIWGCGASATQWETLPVFEVLFGSPNFAHNEYLQVWVDYGILGLILTGGTLLAHAAGGLWAVSSEHMDMEQRKQKLISFVVVGALAVCAFSDYIWHFYSIASMTAFCCGVLASPCVREKMVLPWQKKWASSDKRSLVLLRAQGLFGNGMISICCLMMVVYAGWLSLKLYPAWMSQWHFAALCAPNQDDDAQKRHCIQEDILDSYPDASIMDYYFSMPLSGISWQRQEMALKKVLVANPKNLYVVAMLGDVLCYERKHEEAEKLYRKYFSGSLLKNAMTPTPWRNWHAYYAYNLLRWGYQKMRLGDSQSAYSMMDYALNINAKMGIVFCLRVLPDRETWRDRKEGHPEARSFIKLCTKYVELFKMLDIQKNDSWKEPLEKGGNGALYQDLGHKQRPEPKKKRKRKSPPKNKH